MLGSDELIKTDDTLHKHSVTTRLQFLNTWAQLGRLAEVTFFPVLRHLDTGTQANTTIGWLGFYANKKLILLR